MWAIFRLRSNFSGAAIQDVWGVFWVLGGGGGEISFVSIVDVMGIDLAPSPPPPNPNTQKTPHTSCIAAPEKLDRNLKMAHI